MNLILNLVMKLLWILLPVNLLWVQAQNVTEVRVKLGQNEILTCSTVDSDTYWYLEIYSQVRGSIGRSFGDDPSDSHYDVSTDGEKYSLFGNKLMIFNVSADDCRLYYCYRKINDRVQFVDTFRLVSDVPLTPSYVSEEIPPLVTMFQNKFLIYGSLALNVSLLLLVGLVSLLVCLRMKKMKNDGDCQLIDPSPGSSTNPETLDSQQYAEIQLPQLPPPPPSSQCIYSKAQLPLPPGR